MKLGGARRELKDYPFTLALATRFSDIDPQRHVNNVVVAEYHQQYLAKNPNGYCGIGGCGVPFKSAELQMDEKA